MGNEAGKGPRKREAGRHARGSSDEMALLHRLRREVSQVGS